MGGEVVALLFLLFLYVCGTEREGRQKEGKRSDRPPETANRQQRDGCFNEVSSSLLLFPFAQIIALLLRSNKQRLDRCPAVLIHMLSHTAFHCNVLAGAPRADGNISK